MLEFDRALAVGASGAVFGPVPDAVVGLHGPDARRFANGMFTNNVRDLAVGQWGRSFGLDDRGRIIMQIDVLCVGEQGFEVIVEGGADGFVERYEKFLLFDDVELTDRSGEHEVWTIQGVDARAIAAEACAGRPWTQRSRSPWGGVDVLVRREAAEDLADQLAAASRATPAALDALRVLAGQPRWPRDIGPKRLPSELDVRGSHLSFDKGCYIGQESVNRIDVMGRVRRSLALIQVDGAPAADGAEVTSAEGEKAGAWTSGVALPSGGSAGLAVVRTPNHEVGRVVRVGGVPGRVVARPHLPG